LCVALMLIILGLLNPGSFKRTFASPRFTWHFAPRLSASSTRLAGFRRGYTPCSPADSQSSLAAFYSSIFAAGTIAGMMLITAIIALPITYSANRFQLLNRHVGAAADAFSLALGLFLVHQIGFVDGLFR
jgi:hypothetical protein